MTITVMAITIYGLIISKSLPPRKRRSFDGDADWTEQPDGSWKSGTIADNQETSIIKSVSGKGTLTFQWKVSSEYGYDKLTFYIDNVSKDVISGTSGVWANKTYDIDTAGTHTFKWTYAKDVSYYDGSDCGWIKDVVWTPEALIPEVASGASAQAVNAAVDGIGFADAERVKEAIGGSAEEYNNFKAWAGSVRDASGAVAGEAAVVANANAAAAFLLGAERLFNNAPTVELGEVELVADDGGSAGTSPLAVTLSVTVKDGSDPVAVASEKVKQMFEATSDLSNWYGTAKLTPTVTPITGGQGSVLKFKVKPGDGTSVKAFLRIRK